MNISLRRYKLLSLFVALWLVTVNTLPVWAQDAAPSEQAPPQPVDVTPAIQQAKAHIRDNQFDEAISVLNAALEAARFDADRLREIYLLLIKSYVSGGNFHALQAQGRTTSELFYRQAEDLVRECLSTYQLRHTIAEPAQEFPPEMHEMIDRVRREIFGGLHVTKLAPAKAEVVLDGVKLEAQEDNAIRETDLAIGEHFLVVRHEGYQDLAETIVISPASTLERAFTLQKKRGWGWRLTRIGAPVVAAVGLVAALVSGGSGDETPKPLPGPPDPPGN